MYLNFIFMGFYLNQPDSFFTDIEAAFGCERGKPYRSSPKDWQLMQTWQTAGIPLHVVTRAIKDCFKRKSDIGSLAYCANAVEREHGDWKASQVGVAVVVQETPVSCEVCNDLGEVPQKPENAIYDWQLEFVPCPACQNFLPNNCTLVANSA